MPETARYTALVAGGHDKANADMAKVLERDIPVGESGTKPLVDPNSAYELFSREFLRRHGTHLLGTTTTWFLLDIAFYSLKLTQKDIYPSIGLLPRASAMNAIEEVYKLSRAMLLVALFATVPLLLSTCHEVSAAAGKAGAILAVLVRQCYTHEVEGVQKAIQALAVNNLIGFFFSFLVPETKDRSLEEVSGEDNDFGGNGVTAVSADEKAVEASAAIVSKDKVPEAEMVMV
ncbi:hypothetical protein C1H46_040263 [Malus baccata]|uniref:Uncharacterized protein n=1 Tax=Malus baccata TaxID=106549 RepID=A0A540KJ01_MALBA|nr:hypothetical protein C1H46_040263 [Malus baccata]